MIPLSNVQALNVKALTVVVTRVIAQLIAPQARQAMQLAQRQGPVFTVV